MLERRNERDWGALASGAATGQPIGTRPQARALHSHEDHRGITDARKLIGVLVPAWTLPASAMAANRRAALAENADAGDVRHEGANIVRVSN